MAAFRRPGRGAAPSDLREDPRRQHQLRDPETLKREVVGLNQAIVVLERASSADEYRRVLQSRPWDQIVQIDTSAGGSRVNPYMPRDFAA